MLSNITISAQHPHFIIKALKDLSLKGEIMVDYEKLQKLVIEESQEIIYNQALVIDPILTQIKDNYHPKAATVIYIKERSELR